MFSKIKPKVLIVDDSPESLHVLVDALRSSCSLVVAKDGQQALKMACMSPLPEVILLDVVMPGTDGYQVFRQLKERALCREIPVLFITALQDVEQEHLALSMGAVDFIRKPINPLVVKSRTMTHVELARARIRLQEQNQQLQETVKMRDLVERMMHHDLKGPLGAIIGIPEAIKEDANLTSEQKKLLDLLSKSGLSMLEMINRSLDIYKIEEGSYSFCPVAVDVLFILDRLVAENQPLIEGKGCPVEIHAPAGESPWLIAAEELLCRSLFSNLLKNALEATPMHTSVTLTLSRESEQVVVRIHNQGAVPLAIREKFFSKFATFGKLGGTGLGCYSAMLMARVQKAQLAMTTSEEEGTTLIVRFQAWKEKG
ncbi:MAG: hybrid sensor histidine kinase/response regulator [Magnetococcus sp. DMHC-6]